MLINTIRQCVAWLTVVSSLLWLPLPDSGAILLVDKTPPDSVTVFVAKTAKQQQTLEFRAEGGSFEMLAEGYHRLAIPVTILDTDSKRSVVYVLNKSDSIRFVFDARSGFWWIRTGNQQREQLLNLHVAYRQQYPNQQTGFSMLEGAYWDEKDQVKREKLIQADWEKQLAFINEYAIKYRLKDKAIKDWIEVLNFSRLRRLIVGATKHGSVTYLRKLIGLRTQYDRDSLVFFPDYIQGAEMCAFLAAKTAYGLANVTLTRRYQMADSLFTGLTRDRLLFGVALGGLENWFMPSPSKQEVQTITTRFMADCKEPRYRTQIQQILDLANTTVTSGTLLSKDRKPIALREAASTAPLTYVDFWASWCGPCREEMPASQELKQTYGPKGVRFLYVSLDVNPTAWETAMRSLGLREADSYLLPDNFKSTLARQFKIKSIPHYLLLDQQGKVISANAPRPSTPAIRTLLNQHLKQ